MILTVSRKPVGQIQAALGCTVSKLQNNECKVSAGRVCFPFVLFLINLHLGKFGIYCIVLFPQWDSTRKERVLAMTKLT